MIPRRVTLKGFLSYRDEQTVAFDGPSLWMLSGLNGSGKSSVFDAVTFALFGHHRGGAQQQGELINKDCDRLGVEFWFEVDRRLYRARRTVKRRANGTFESTHQIDECPSGDGKAWQAVPDTGGKDGFKRWVDENIGLTYETFTSSVLLLQGRAEKLLDSKPAGRAAVLAGIVDLERYQRLHERADARRKEWKAALDAAQRRLDEVPEVTPAETMDLDGRAEDAAEALEKAKAEAARLGELVFQSRGWAEAGARLAEQKRKLADARALIRDAAAIEKDIARLRELREVLPAVNAVLQERNRGRDAQARAEKLAKDREALAAERAGHAKSAEEARRKRDTAQADAAANDTRLQQLNVRLRELAGVLKQVRLHDEQKAQLDRLTEDLKAYPPRPFDVLEAERKALEDLVALGQTLPQLTRFSEARAELAAARDTERAAKDAEAKVVADGKRTRAERDALAAKHKAAAEALRAAEGRLAEARALANQAAAQCEEFRSLDGAKVCRACGQALTAEHRKAELDRRRRDLAAAEARRDALDTEHKKSAAAEGELHAALQESEQRLVATREDYERRKAAAAHARSAVERLETDCGRVYHELPGPFRTRVSPTPPADWAATAFPTPADLKELRNRAAGAESARRRVRDAEKVQADWSTLNGRLQTVRETLAGLASALPDDPAGVRREHDRLRAEEEAVGRSVQAARDNAKQAQADLDRFTRQVTDADRRLAECDGKLGTEAATRKAADDAVARSLAALPAGWREKVGPAGMRELSVWRDEQSALAAAGVETKATGLQAARVQLAALEQAEAEARAACDAVPEDARRDPKELAAQSAAAAAAAEARREELAAVQQQRKELERRAQRRVSLLADVGAAEAEHKHFNILSQLLGRDRLQRHLVRSAERQIVDHANAVLDRLSGGSLALRLVGGDDSAGGEKALELEAYNRVTGGSPINVAFLSGSQRFRVAVALALGIGQYASRRHRPIEAVIIDEGFGCLDRQGRQVMIQELQNLRGHLQCILLVSHQEEFADAFADAYHFELTDQGTQVNRVSR